MSAVLGKSGKCQGNPLLHRNVRELSGKFDPFLHCQGSIMKVLPFPLTSKNGAIKLNHHVSPLCHYLFCETSMVERSKEYKINDEQMFFLLAKRAFSSIIEGVN